jgi:hypothetical protein
MHPGEMAPIEEAYFIRVWYVVGIKAATSAIVQFQIHSLCFSTLLILLAFSYASSRYCGLELIIFWIVPCLFNLCIK